MPRLSANYDDVRVALEYLDTWRNEPSAVLAPLRASAAVRMPSDKRIRPSVEVAQRHAAEDAEIRAAEEAAALEARRKLHDELSRPLSGGRMVSVAQRTCEATTAGQPCRRPPSHDRPYCLAHDPDRKAEHAGVSSLGGTARHDPEVSSIKAEVREIKAALWSARLTPGAASVLLQAARLEREIDTEDRDDASSDTFITSIQALRASGVPDLSEPANDPPGGNDRIARTAQEARVRHDDEIAERKRRREASMADLTIAERRERWQSKQRSGG